VAGGALYQEVPIRARLNLVQQIYGRHSSQDRSWYARRVTFGLDDWKGLVTGFDVAGCFDPDGAALTLG